MTKNMQQIWAIAYSIKSISEKYNPISHSMTIKVRHQTGKTNTYIHPYCINGHANPPKSYKRGLHVTSLTQNGHLEAPQPGPHINKKGERKKTNI